MTGNKTLFITVFHSFITKNILATDAFKSISANKDLNIVLLVPEIKKEFFQSLYGSGNVIIEGVPVEVVANNRRTKLFSIISHLLIDANYPTYKRRERLGASRNLRGYVKFAVEVIASKLLSGNRLVNKVFRKLLLNHLKIDEVEKVFDRYKPAAVFSTDIFDEIDCLVAAEAKRRGVKLIGMVRSWDNCYSKGLMRVLPDKLIVNNEALKGEAHNLHQVPLEHIAVLGSPQYDIFVKKERTPRAEFFASMGLDANKKLVLFAPAGTVLSDTDSDLIEIFKEAIDLGQFAVPVQFLIRNHPNHPADVKAIVGHEDMVVEDPGKPFNRNNPKDTELTLSDNEHLADELYYADVVVWVATTLGMDAVVFDKPQIAVDFDGYKKKPYYKSVMRYHDEDHMQKMLALGGVTVAMSPEELISATNRYLKDPDSDKNGRERVRKQQFYKLDGQAGKRIGEYIVSELAKA